MNRFRWEYHVRVRDKVTLNSVYSTCVWPIRKGPFLRKPRTSNLWRDIRTLDFKVAWRTRRHRQRQKIDFIGSTRTFYIKWGTFWSNLVCVRPRGTRELSNLVRNFAFFTFNSLSRPHRSRNTIFVGAGGKFIFLFLTSASLVVIWQKLKSGQRL